MELDSTLKFNIYSSFTLSNDDVSCLSLLYAPLIGSDAFTLYMAFTSLLERNNLKSEEITHDDFFSIYSMDTKSFLLARYKLEGIGLLMTLKNNESYTYVLCPPFTPKNFIKDAVLGLYLYAKVGKNTFNFIHNHFKIEAVEKKDYENITKSFDEVYTSITDNEIIYEKFSYLLGKKPARDIKINPQTFDFDKFLKDFNMDYLEYGLTEAFKNQIINIAFVYGFDEHDMNSIMPDSLNKNNYYDYRLLKKSANKLFVYKKNKEAPNLATIVDDEFMLANDDLITYMDNASAKDILNDTIGEENYTANDLDRITEIYASLEFPKGVISCMIIRAFRELGKIPSPNYFKKMATSWAKDNILSTAIAVKYISTEKEIKSYNNSNSSNSIKNKKLIDENGGIEEL